MKELLRFELQRLERGLADYRAGILPAQEFVKIRTRLGIYAIRDSQDRYMLRVKIPAGKLSIGGLAMLAAISKETTPTQSMHITTRQDIELHGIPETRLTEVLERLMEVGMTTLGSGGPGVRNIVCCPFSGVSPREAFDVEPYAQALSRYFLGHASYETLPKKMKISFESCPEDHVGLAAQDIGIQAAHTPEGERYFRILVGGGLGALPMRAQGLEEHTPLRLLLPTVKAVLNVFDKHGERKDHARARLKFLVQKMGMEAFRKAVFVERAALAAERILDIADQGTEEKPRHKAQRHSLFVNAKFDRWKFANMRTQQESGLCSVFLRCPLGDIGSEQARRIGFIARDFAGGSLRTTVTQNLLLRDVWEERLPELYRELDAIGMASCCAEQVMDVTRCVGGETCLSSITSSKNLASALEALFLNGLGKDPAVKHLSIKISGCPNSCSHHHLADIGLYGMAKTVGGRVMPGYQILLGGKAKKEATAFGQPIGMVPAAKAVSAVEAVVRDYAARRGSDDNFSAFVSQRGADYFKELLSEPLRLPGYEEDAACFRDLGEEHEFRLKARRGECSV